jgi:hypothetical protein
VITSEGIKAWTVNLTFSFREKGWNQFYNIKNEMFQAVYVVGHSDPAEIYPSADFITEFGVGR